MRKAHILIVEDEPIIADDLAYTLEELGYGVTGIAHDARDAITHISLQKPDLVLLDINLEGEEDGIFVATQLHSKYHIPFVFLTSLADKRTLDRAKVTEPSGYLVKPVNENDLRSTLEIALYNFNQRQHPRQESNFILKEAIFIKDHYRLIKVALKDIQYAEASNNYCYIHTEKKKYVLSVTLKLVAQRLQEWHFLRIHRTYMINPAHIDEVSDRSVIIAGRKLPISRKYYEEFMRELQTL